MLRERVMTAVVLLAILAMAFVFVNPMFVVALVAAVLCGAVWEWQRLSTSTQGSLAAAWVTTGLGFMCLLLGYGLTALWFPLILITVLACVFWVLFAPFILRHRQMPALAPIPRALLGVVLVLAACAAIFYVGSGGRERLGAVLLIPIVADTAAYFVGKRFGKRKLAPAISPGKTIEGAIGGLTAVALVHGGWVISQGWGWWWILIFIVLAVFSIVGDLFESLLKRQAGVKDSSNLLPGHGGVLDRIDAQLPVLPLAALAFHFLPLR